MGVMISVPKLIRLQIDEISHNNSETIVIDSNSYNQNLEWISNACRAASNNKNIKKIVFKLYLKQSSSKTISKALAKALKDHKNITIYGSGLMFLEEYQ